jgi:hypothetical protein
VEALGVLGGGCHCSRYCAVLSHQPKRRRLAASQKSKALVYCHAHACRNTDSLSDNSLVALTFNDNDYDAAEQRGVAATGSEHYSP